MQAAIFDFDGTLVDSMPLHFEAYRRTFAEHGLTLPSERFEQSVGGTASETIPLLLGDQRPPVSIPELHARKKAILAAMLADEEIPVLEFAKLLPLLHGRVPVALASSGSRPGIDQMLGRLGWSHYFAVVVTGEDVEHGKPAPDLFLLAADRLGVAPSGCLVFEDTDAGLAAAAAAGMTAIDVRA